MRAVTVCSGGSARCAHDGAYNTRRGELNDAGVVYLQRMQLMSQKQIDAIVLSVKRGDLSTLGVETGPVSQAYGQASAPPHKISAGASSVYVIFFIAGAHFPHNRLRVRNDVQLPYLLVKLVDPHPMSPPTSTVLPSFS